METDIFYCKPDWPMFVLADDLNIAKIVAMKFVNGRIKSTWGALWGAFPENRFFDIEEYEPGPFSGIFIGGPEETKEWSFCDTERTSLLKYCDTEADVIRLVKNATRVGCPIIDNDDLLNNVVFRNASLPTGNYLYQPKRPMFAYFQDSGVIGKAELVELNNGVISSILTDCFSKDGTKDYVPVEADNPEPFPCLYRYRDLIVALTFDDDAIAVGDDIPAILEQAKKIGCPVADNEEEAKKLCQIDLKNSINHITRNNYE